MDIQYRFVQVYADIKGRKEKAKFRQKVCETCNYKEAAFWQRLRNEVPNVTAKEIAVWMALSGKSFNDIVVYNFSQS